jgi:hypothetical protein
MREPTDHAIILRLRKRHPRSTHHPHKRFIRLVTSIGVNTMPKLPPYLPALAFLAMLASATSPAWAEPVAAGQTWALDDARGPVVKFSDCGSGLCASLVALGPVPVAPQDRNNPAAALRNRPVCGLTIISGLTRTNKGLSGGTIYDPQTGRTHPMSINDRGARPKIAIPFGPFSASMAMLSPSGVQGQCPR